MKKLRIAIIGCENMGRKHLACLQKHFSDKIKIAGIINSNPESSQNTAKDLDARAFDSLNEINHKNTDAIILATPPETHHEIAKSLLERGFPLLIEKPFAETLEQCLELKNIAQEKNIPLMIGHTENYNPAVVLLQKLMDTPIKSIAAIRTSQNPGIKKTHIISELMVYDLAIAQALVVGDWLEARVDKQEKYRWDEHAIVEMRYDSGTIIKLEALRHSEAELKRQMRIIDTKNNIWKICFMKRELYKNNEILCSGGDSLKNELDKFVEMVTLNKTSPINLEKACNVVKLCKELEDITY